MCEKINQPKSSWLQLCNDEGNSVFSLLKCKQNEGPLSRLPHLPRSPISPLKTQPQFQLHVI